MSVIGRARDQIALTRFIASWLFVERRSDLQGASGIGGIGGIGLPERPMIPMVPMVLGNATINAECRRGYSLNLKENSSLSL
jgi:hypothetical protein